MKNPIPCLPIAFLSGVSLLALGACAEVSPAASTPVPAAPAAAAVPGAIKYAPPATVTITPSRTTALPARAAVTSGVIDTTKLRTTPNAVGSRTDVILGGHDHSYERFARQTPTGAPDAARGIREFVVGTGGASHYGQHTLQPNSERFDSTAFGVLKLTLGSGEYAWEFVPVAGSTFRDGGSDRCGPKPYARKP